MVFIMRASVSDKSFFCYSLLYCFFVWLLPVSGFASTSSVEVKNAGIILQGDSYVLSADIDYQLSARAKEALQNGVPLFWILQVKLQQHRDYFWDKTLVSRSIRYRIQYHALLNMYRVRIENGGEMYNFSTLAAALSMMSAVRDLRIIDKAGIVPGKRYFAGIQVKLDRDALPLPLRPIAYTNPQWYLSSDWYVWSLTK
jgi:hypothetical protein